MQDFAMKYVNMREKLQYRQKTVQKDASISFL